MSHSLMILGTMSGAGKTLLTAGLCRLFARKGIRVAPFKAQNMALNSYVTPEGLEIGRAQALQAQAAGITPDVRMNPILLKPTADHTSQLMLHGEICGEMDARTYYTRKEQLLPEVLGAYERLCADYDLILIEGAGSPAEINLRSVDLVNMGLAQRTKSPCLLVGDIDRGGVFAQLYGTYALLSPDDRALLRGFIINKFRGDPALLSPGPQMLTEKTGLPCLGILPYAPFDLEDEDSLAPRLHPAAAADPSEIDLAVIRLPHISNFTDFMPLERMEGVRLRYVEQPAQLGCPDMIFLPGTKTTLHDLHWLRATGLEAKILQAHSRGVPLCGICGGYQMLGKQVTEHGQTCRGLGLLNVETVFSPEKIRRRRIGVLPENAPLHMGGLTVRGYEIHMGQTKRAQGVPPLLCDVQDMDHPASAPETDGAFAPDGTVFGSYFHGFFDEPPVPAALVAALREKRGLPADAPLPPDPMQHRNAEFDRLADLLAAHLDMAAIEEIIWGAY